MERLISIDANAIIHRAFHALPPLKNKEGKQRGAVYGFALFFLKALKDFKPAYAAAAFDYPAPTFRHKEYKPYKAKRTKAPDELYEQIPEVKKLLQSFGVKCLEAPGFEADDILGAIAEKVRAEENLENIILTGDMDALQLVDEKTKVNAISRRIKEAVLYGKKEIAQKFGGLAPGQLVDFKALRGDPSDNIPGEP